MDHHDIVEPGHGRQRIQPAGYRRGTVRTTDNDARHGPVSRLCLIQVVFWHDDDNMAGTGFGEGLDGPVEHRFSAQRHPLLAAAGAAAGPTGDDNGMKRHGACLARNHLRASRTFLAGLKSCMRPT